MKNRQANKLRQCFSDSSAFHAAKIALKNNLIVIVLKPKEKRDKSFMKNFSFSDGKGMGYFELDGLCGMNISTSYLPSRENGTGASYQIQEWYKGKELAKELKNALYFRPHWVRGAKSYENVYHYLRESWRKEDLLIFYKDKSWTYQNFIELRPL